MPEETLAAARDHVVELGLHGTEVTDRGGGRCKRLAHQALRAEAVSGELGFHRVHRAGSAVET